MSDIVESNPSPDHALQPVVPRMDFSIRLATMDDFGWIDAMQKAESDKLGFLMKVAIEKRIEQGNVLVAEQREDVRCSMADVRQGKSEGAEDSSHIGHRTSNMALGYCIAVDRYMKQDHVGQFVQLNIAPGSRRSLVGAALVKATFEKSAYGVKLYGLWCRQDLAANRFWESLGFVPLAFRAAGVNTLEKIKRKTGGTSGGVHIYWQRRVRDGDTQTAYWFPYETSGGMMAESRVVLPIPLGTHWSDAKPVVLPGAERRAEEARLLDAGADAKAQADKAALAAKRKEARDAAKVAKQMTDAPKTVHGVETTSNAAGVPMGFDLPPEAKAQKAAEQKAARAAAEKERIKQEKREAKRAAKQARRKTDPELLAFSRELRDRWQEAVAPGSEGAALLADAGRGKYDVGRLLENVSTHQDEHGPMVIVDQPSRTAEQKTLPEARRLDAA